MARSDARELGLLIAAAIGIATGVLAGCAAEPPRVIERRTSDVPAPRGPGLLRQAMLNDQNAARAAAGAAPLAWSETLAADALVYAHTLADSGRFQHADQPQGPGREGENLWTGTRGAFSYDEMVGHWVAEKKDVVDLPVPSSSRTGRFGDVGHYTQIVWRATTEVGCALASNATDDYVVCRYSPPGNIVGLRDF